MAASTAMRENANPPELQSLSVIEFGPGNVLFVGDSKSATLFAFDLGEARPPEGSQFYNVKDIDASIAALLGAPLDEITIKDLAVHPVTQDAYLAVHRGHGDAMIPIVVKVNANREITVLELGQLPHTKVTLQNPIDATTKLRNFLSARLYTITAITFHGGDVFVSGLSNAEFSSTLYRIPYPFRDTVTTTSIEIFHAVHAQNETRAPIEAMAILPLGDKPHVLATYTCTPLVTIAVDELKDGAHIKAKTIGELGYGNTPIAILPFQTRDSKGHVEDHILITHKHRGPMLFSVQAIAESNAKDGISAGVEMMTVVAPKFTEIPMAGLSHMSDQGQGCLLGLRRDFESGRLALLSFDKGIYFRVSEYFTEFQMPSYSYKNANLLQWHKNAFAQQGVTEEG